MPHRLLIVLSLFIGAFSSCAFAISSGERPPNFLLLDSQEKKVSLENFKGKILYIDFWASWCPSCRRSLPWMNDIQNKYGREKLEIIAINLDEDKEDAVRLLKDINSQITVLFDPEGDTARIYNVKAMPTSLLIDSEGKVVSVFQGFKEETEEQIEQELERLLK